MKTMLCVATLLLAGCGSKQPRPLDVPATPTPLGCGMVAIFDDDGHITYECSCHDDANYPEVER